jgi:hypothetical protein
MTLLWQRSPTTAVRQPVVVVVVVVVVFVKVVVLVVLVVYVEVMVVVVVVDPVTVEVVVIVVVAAGMKGKAFSTCCHQGAGAGALGTPPLPPALTSPWSSSAVRRPVALSGTRKDLLLGVRSQTPTDATSSTASRPSESQTPRRLRKNCSRTESRW